MHDILGAFRLGLLLVLCSLLLCVIIPQYGCSAMSLAVNADVATLLDERLMNQVGFIPVAPKLISCVVAVFLSAYDIITTDCDLCCADVPWIRCEGLQQGWPPRITVLISIIA